MGMRTFVPNEMAGPQLLAALAPRVRVLDVDVEPNALLLIFCPAPSTLPGDRKALLTPRVDKQRSFP
jgi:hypothetical protein